MRRTARHWVSGLVLFAAGVHGVEAGATPRHLAGDEASEVAFLMAVGTADSLATASLLSHLIDSRRAMAKQPDPTALLRRAVALQPNRPELWWLMLRDCEFSQCPQEQSIVERLRAADPDNGIALLPALSASLRGAPEDTTRVIAQIGAAKQLTLYWNKTLVGMFDALTHGARSRPATALSHDADDRLAHVTGVLAAVDIPPFRPITRACASDQFGEAGRRAACDSLMSRLDASDTLIAQSLSVSVRLKWWPAGTAEATMLRNASLQQRYLVEASGRARGSKVNDDAEARVNAMRRLSGEKEVDEAMLTAFSEPLDRPVDWQGAVPP